jgi:O-Antigen ligase
MRAMPDSRRVAGAALLLVPAGLVVFFGFNSGGFYPGPTSYVAVLLCIALALRVTMATDPFEGVGLGTAVAWGALALFALLTLLSQYWSHAPGRALVEFDRVLVYLLMMVLLGTVAHTRTRLVWILRALALAIIVICACGLITRLLPHVWPTTPELASNRLSFPLTYWNALGVLGAVGVVLCLHFSSDPSESAVIRVCAAAAIPLVATTIYFTFSRGGIAAALIGVVLYVLIARPRALLSAILAAGPTAAVAVDIAYHANVLATPTPTVAAGIAQGRHVALALLICTGVAGAVRGGLIALGLDQRLQRFTLPKHAQARARRLGWGTLAAVVLISAVAMNGAIAHEYRRFVSPASPGNAADLRARLTDPGNNGRLDMWRVGWHQFERAPALGHGAGTFANTWARYRPTQDSVLDSHSLYIETLDELGIVGFVLLVGVVAAVLVRTAARARGRNRALYAAAFVVMLIWALHTGIDWDWEMPAVTVPFFALGGFMLARSRARSADVGVGSSSGGMISAPGRTILALGCLLLAVAPTYLWLSQRRLDQATTAFAQGNCRAATSAALSSISVLGDRPEPYEVLSYCDVRRDMPGLAVAAMRKAISLDPGNWNYRYDLAVIRASAGLNPVPALRAALSLDPREPMVWTAFRRLSVDRPAQWEKNGKVMADEFTL